MKAVVLQISGKQAAVLADDGCMHNIPNRDYQTGQQVALPSRKQGRLMGWAAAAAMLCVGTTCAWAALAPYYYVSLDVNPSVEYTLNRFDRVLSVKGVNDDGSELLLELGNMGNKTIDKAISETVSLIGDNGYFDNALEGGVVISTSAKDMKKAEQLASHLRNEVEKTVGNTNKPMHVDAVAVGRERVDEAHKLGITPGKLNLIEKLKEATGDANMSYNEWLDKPVKDIMKAIKDSRIDIDDLDDLDDLDDWDDWDDLHDDLDDKHDKDDDYDKHKPNDKPKPNSKPDRDDDNDDLYDDLDDLDDKHDKDNNHDNKDKYDKDDKDDDDDRKPSGNKQNNGKPHRDDKYDDDD